MRRPSRRSTAITAICLAVAAAVTVTVAVSWSGSSSAHPPAAVSTIDAQPRVCLLTASDTATETSAHVWAGISRAADEAGRVTTQRYTLPPHVMAGTYLNTLAHMRCSVIVTIGDALRPTGTVATGPGKPHYIAVSAHPADPSHTTSLTPAAATEQGIAEAVRAALDTARHS